MLELQNLKQPAVALKGIQILLLIIALSTFGGNGLHWTYFVMSTMLGCFLNAVALLVCFLFGYMQIQKTPLEFGLSVYYCIAIFATSILLMATGYPMWIASGVFCLFLSFVYAADVFFAYSNLTSRPTSFPPSMTPASSPPQPTAGDSVDGGVSNPNMYVTNPTYPATVNYPHENYPPQNDAPQYQTQPNYPPPEYPTNIPIQAKP